jgi:hypothetical protein
LKNDIWRKKIYELPDSLRGLPQNRWGGYRTQKQRTFGGKFGAASEVKRYTPEEIKAFEASRQKDKAQPDRPPAMNGSVIDKVLRTKRKVEVATGEELAVTRTLGKDFLQDLTNPGMLDIALSDLGVIKEMRPDLDDRNLAYLVRTADDDEDAEAWMMRVQKHVAGSRLDNC